MTEDNCFVEPEGEFRALKNRSDRIMSVVYYHCLLSWCGGAVKYYGPAQWFTILLLVINHS